MNITTSRRKLLSVFTVATALLNMLLLIAPCAQAGPLAYVADDFLSLVRVVDTADNTLLATVNEGNRAYGAAFNATGTRAYVASDVSNELFVQDTSSNRLSADVPVGDAFLNGSSDGVYSTVVQLAGTRIATIPLGDFAEGVAINPAGTRVYVANGNNVSVIDTASNTVIATVAMGTTAYANPIGVAVNPAGTRAYVTNSSESTVSVIDTATNTVIANVSVGPVFTGWNGPPAASPSGVAVNPNGNEVYVANSGNDTVAVIDTATNEVTSTVPVAILTLGPAIQGGTTERPRRPFFIAVNPAGTLVYVANSATSTVTTINAADPCGSGTTETVGIGYTGGTQQEFKLFLNPNAGPLPVVGPAPPNLRVTGMEVTQGIQDLANSVRLVSGRRTFVRVYVQSDGAAVPGVTATLSGAGVYSTIGGTVTVPLDAINPSNTVGPRITVSPNPKRSNLNDSFLFELPWEWTNFESLRLKVALTANPGPPKKVCPAEVLNAPFHYFELFTTLKVQFVRLRYSLPGAPSNTFEEASSGEQRQSESWIRRIYPLSELLSTSDLILFDSGLGARVDRSAKECGQMKADERSLCAHRYITGRLAALQISSGFMGDADAGYGLIPQTVAGSCAPAADGSMPCFTRGACCTARSIGAGPSNSTDYAAHEIGHFLGRNHPVEGATLCGHSATDPNYPYFFSFIAPPLSDPETGLAGFDGGDPNLLIPMSLLSPRDTYDIMGYCKPSWISDYTYEALRTALLALHSSVGRSTFGSGVVAGGPEPAVPQMGDWLMAFGNITPDLHTANFTQTQRVDRVVSVPTRTPGNYSIRLIGTGGVTLADYPFTPAVVEDTVLAGGSSPPPLSFGQVVPFVADTQKIQIVDNSVGSAVIGTKTVSAHPPTINNVVLPGASDPVTGTVTVGWTASDLDGDPLTFDVFLVRDGGGGSVSLQPLMVGVTDSSLQIDTARLGGGVARFRVVANDGVQSAFADSPTFNLANKPPRPRIMTPADGTSVYVGQLVNLEGEAIDPQLQEGAVPSTTLEWSRPGKVLGTGSKLSVTDLPMGVNQITLTATNSLGLSAATSVTVTVKGSTDLPGPTLTAGPGQIGWNVQVGELQAQTATLNIGNSGSGVLGFTAHSDASWLSLSATTGTAPATLTLTANPAGFAGGVTETATVTLAATGDPSQVIKIPVTLAVGNTFVVGRAPAVTDTVAPVVTPPADITVAATESGGVRGSASAVLAAFLTGGSAVDAVDPAPTKLAPQIAGVDANNATLLPIGVTTPVSFRFRDASGNVGSAAANVTVILGQPRLSIAAIAKGVYSPGILFVDLKLTNTGTGNARNVVINQISLRTLRGSGTVTYNAPLSPAFPNAVGNLNVGASTTLRLYLNLPSTVSRFSLTENGALQNVAGTGIRYSVGQAVTP